MSFRDFNPDTYSLATPAIPATVETAVSDASPPSPLSHRDMQIPVIRELHFEDIMALPIRPCTICARLQWQEVEFEGRHGMPRTRLKHVCTYYDKSPLYPKTGCRCAHFESR